MGIRNEGGREFREFKPQFLAVVAQGVTGCGFLELRHRYDGPGPRTRHRLLFFSGQAQQLTETFLGGFVDVVKAAISPKGSGNDTKNGKSAGIGVCHCLENKGRKGAVGIRSAFQLVFRPCRPTLATGRDQSERGGSC